MFWKLALGEKGMTVFYNFSGWDTVKEFCNILISLWDRSTCTLRQFSLVSRPTSPCWVFTHTMSVFLNLTLFWIINMNEISKSPGTESFVNFWTEDHAGRMYEFTYKVSTYLLSYHVCNIYVMNKYYEGGVSSAPEPVRSRVAYVVTATLAVGVPVSWATRGAKCTPLEYSHL
jgi:hypothetical protein